MVSRALGCRDADDTGGLRFDPKRIMMPDQSGQISDSQSREMSEKEKDMKGDWIDPDDAPEWTDEMFDRAQISVGGVVVREATGTLTKSWKLTRKPRAR